MNDDDINCSDAIVAILFLLYNNASLNSTSYKILSNRSEIVS